MNIYAQSNGRCQNLSEIGALSIADRVRPVWGEARELVDRRSLSSIHQLARRAIPLARQLSPIVVRTWLDALPSARSSFNFLLDQLLHPLLVEGERDRLRQEAEWFRARGTQIVVVNSAIAHQAALTEVLAAIASETKSESEAAGFIGTMLPIVLRVMEGHRSLCPFLPALLSATARLVRLLYRHSRGGQSLLRLLPTIFRRTIASLQTARRWGYRLTTALLGCVLAAHTRRVLGNAQIVGESIVRNALIQAATVAV